MQYDHVVQETTLSFFFYSIVYITFAHISVGIVNKNKLVGHLP